MFSGRTEITQISEKQAFANLLQREIALQLTFYS